MTRQILRRAAFRVAYEHTDGEYRYIGKNGHTCYTIPRRARRRIARAKAKEGLRAIDQLHTESVKASSGQFRP